MSFIGFIIASLNGWYTFPEVEKVVWGFGESFSSFSVNKIVD